MAVQQEDAALDKACPDISKVRILLADDHPLLRFALKSVLENQTEFKVVAEAGDGEEAVALVEKEKPDVIIMDIGMPRLNGLDATRRIKEAHPEIAVLVLTVHNDTEHIMGILEAGADGYLTKSIFGKELVDAVRSVSVGESVLSREIMKKLLQHALRYPSQPQRLDDVQSLTERELDILRLATRGISNKDIAKQLKLSIRTVKGHLAEVFTKLHARSRTEAVIKALRAGLVSLNDLE